jgi:hypothetical protein
VHATVFVVCRLFIQFVYSAVLFMLISVFLFVVVVIVAIALLLGLCFGLLFWFWLVCVCCLVVDWVILVHFQHGLYVGLL